MSTKIIPWDTKPLPSQKKKPKTLDYFHPNKEETQGIEFDQNLEG